MNNHEPILNIQDDIFNVAIDMEIEGMENKLMNELTIKLPLKNFNLNTYTQLARTHWAVSSKAKRQLQQLINVQVSKQLKKQIKTPCSLFVTWNSKTRNFDLDNLLLKSILDELQNMNLLENDNASHIISITHQYKVNKLWQGVTIKFLEE